MSEDKFKLDTIESAIKDIRDGKVVIVVDDKNRENEGDFLAAAELITPEIINFMATHGRGLICAPITENISKRLGLNLMVGTNTDPQDTAFKMKLLHLNRAFHTKLFYVPVSNHLDATNFDPNVAGTCSPKNSFISFLLSH